MIPLEQWRGWSASYGQPDATAIYPRGYFKVHAHEVLVICTVYIPSLFKNGIFMKFKICLHKFVPFFD